MVHGYVTQWHGVGEMSQAPLNTLGAVFAEGNCSLAPKTLLS